MERRRVLVTGEVQGVFFRDSLREEAERHGIDGWVRNCEDGSVEAVFEGEAVDLEAMVEFCRTGPSHADVDDVEVTSEEPEGLDGFEMR